jgi:hypothetical protein
MILKRILVICILALMTSLNCYSQKGHDATRKYRDSTSAYLEISGMATSIERTPFWMQTNQFGTVPRNGSAGTIRGQYENFWSLNDYVKNNPWRAGIGVEVVGNVSKETKVLIPQAHASLRFKNWEFFIGRKKQWIGLADSTIGTGSYPWSGNAMPLPKIQLGTVGFVSVPLTKGFVAFHGFYSEGMFENNRPYTSELKLHQKIFYLRLGKPGSRLKLYGGFNHQVQWGGMTPFWTINGKMSSGWQNYKNLVLGKSGAYGIDSVSYFDNHNRVGNHLGSIDLAMEIDTYGYSLFMYRQSVYEDGSLYALTNIADGLNGIRLRRKNLFNPGFSISEIVVEFLYTKSQGGPEWDLNNPNRGALGRDNYFNNAQVVDGWSYFDRTIGTPFITPTTDTKWKYPIFGNQFSSNNRVSVMHLALKGSASNRVNWIGKFSYSNNIGAYDGPFESPATQFSGYLGVEISSLFLGGSIIKASVASDIGNLYPNSTGLSFGIRKNFEVY